MSDYERCPVCERILADRLEEWDDSPDLLCNGPGSPGCYPSVKRMTNERLAELKSDLMGARDPSENELFSELDRARAAEERLRGELAEALEMLRWCGGSADFNPGGVAREGWVRGVHPLIEKIDATLKAK